MLTNLNQWQDPVTSWQVKLFLITCKVCWDKMAKVERSFHWGRLSFKAGKLGPDSDIGAVLASVSRPKLSSKLAPGPHDLGKLLFFFCLQKEQTLLSANFRQWSLGKNQELVAGWLVMRCALIITKVSLN